MRDLPSIHAQLVALREDFFASLASYRRKVRVKGKRVSQLRRRVEAYELERFIHAYFSLYFEGIQAYPDGFNANENFSCINFGNLDVHGWFKLTEPPLHLVRNYGMELKFNASRFDTFTAGFDMYPYNIMDISFEGGHIDYLDTTRCYFDASDTCIGHAQLDMSFKLTRCKVDKLYASAKSFNTLSLIDTVIDTQIELRYCTIRDASFDRLNASKRAAFLQCKFVQPPSTHGAIFPSDTTFHGSEFGPHIGLLSAFQHHYPNQADIDIYQRYRALRLLMKNAGAVREEAIFFGLELRMRRRAFSAGSKPYLNFLKIDFLLSYLYDVVSGYGTSIKRAILALLGWNALFFLLFLLLLPLDCSTTADCANASTSCKVIQGGKTTSVQRPRVCTAAMLAIQNATSPTSVLSSTSAVRVYSGPLIFMSLLQSIGSLSIGALLLLAIRNNFHRGS
ncbi:hypothetical protein O3297_11000 [Janthinobacterium sp. SUN128]|uniref:hypothetical protein n=1 Tax=Janthinobacterium sp. SUN128 TaxID=3014790 RepID=UPI002712CFD0|nr:hypothetical protein [Janthinobacterium sp. SUN128]MDO8033946.1 hypothetical protein [Janthinobacterium sp. SUN128]